MIWDVATRVPLEVDVLRDRNSLYQENIRGEIENVYTLKIVNKSQIDQTYKIDVEGLSQYRLIGSAEKSVGAGEWVVTYNLAVPPTELSDSITEFNFVVTSETSEGVTIKQESRFIYQ